MANINILSVNIQGTPELLVADHQSVTTSFRKLPANDQDLYLGMEGIIGDSVYHTDVHGGNDKAICCYNADHYSYWKTLLNIDLENAAFGENLTLTGDNALEKNVFIGSQYQLGNATVQVSQPRQPCYIIGVRHNYKKFAVHIQETGFSGFYLRTIKPGKFHSSNQLILMDEHPEKIPVMAANTSRYHNTTDKEMLQRLANLEDLTISWRKHFENLLQK